MAALRTRVDRRISPRSAFPLTPQTAAGFVVTEPTPPPPTRLGTATAMETVDQPLIFAIVNSAPPARVGTGAVTEANDSVAASDIGFGIVLRPDRGITGWDLIAQTAPTNTVSNNGTAILHDAGGFVAGTHISIVSRNLPATDNFAAYGRLQVSAVIDTGNLAANIQGYMRLITLDNLPAVLSSSGQTIGTNTTKWRLGLVVREDGIPRLLSSHEGVTDLELWTGTALSSGAHSFFLDFTPSQGLSGQAIFRVDGVTVLSQSGIQTVPSGVDPSHVLVTHVAFGIYDALNQPTKRLSLRTLYASVNAVVTPVGTVSGTILKTEATDTPTIQGSNGSGGGTVYNRPSSYSQVGLQAPTTSSSLLTDLPPGTYNNVQFLNAFAFRAGQTYTLNNCTGFIFHPGALTPAPTVQLNYCRMGGAFEFGAQAGINGDFCHLIGNDYAWRPKGRNYDGDVVTPTPGLFRSCLFESTGTQSSPTTHCEAVQAIGCNAQQFIACWFYCQPRLKGDGTTANTAALNFWGGNCLFDRCGFGLAGQVGSPFYLVYSSSGPPDGVGDNIFTDPVSGVIGNPAGERPLVDIDFYGAFPAQYMPVVNGRRVPPH